MLEPQHSTPPVPSTAQLNEPSAPGVVAPAADTTLVSPTTGTGVDRLVVVPSPSWPSALSPQHWTVPSVSSAQALKAAAKTADALVIPLTKTGVVLPPVVPLPSSPKPVPMPPQHSTLP